MTPLEKSNTLPTVPNMSQSRLVLLNGTPGSDSASNLPPGLSAAPTFSSLLHALRRRWVLGVPLALIATLTVVCVVFLVLPPQYVAQLRFRIAARPDERVFQNTGGDDGQEFALFKLSKQALLTSPLVLGEALKARLPDGREVRELAIVRAHGGLDWLEKGIKTDFLSGPEYLRAALGADDPEEVAALLNAVGKAFLKVNDEQTRESHDRQLRRYKESLAGLQEEHRKLLQQLISENNSRDVKDKDAQLSRQTQAAMDLSHAKTELLNLRLRKRETEQEINDLQETLKNAYKATLPEPRLDVALREDAMGAAYYRQLDQIAEKVQLYRNTAKPGNRAAETAIKTAQDQSRDIQRQLAQRRQEIRPEVQDKYRDEVDADCKTKLAVERSKLSRMNGEETARLKIIEDLDAAYKAIGTKNEPLPVQVLRSKIAASEKALEGIEHRIREFEIEAPRSRVTLLQEAYPPTQKDFSRQLKMAGGGGLGIFGLVLLGIAFFEFRSRKITMADEVSQGLGINVVGALPALPTRGGRSNAGHVWTNELNEAIDAVRTLLLHAARSEGLRVVMVTSADSGEGKTTLASQLAASLARAWRRTLLVDGDLRNPASHKLFDLPGEPGFSEVLRGEIQVADAIRATALSRLWLLPGGTWDQHAQQALAQDELRTVFDQLKQQYDFIIVDSPPVLPVADSLLLGQHVNGVLFSILRDVSRAPAVYAAQQKLQPLGIQILGAVMVGATTDLGRSQYRYLTHQEEAKATT
jgi:polysaccharide biosynthesis transport protein